VLPALAPLVADGVRLRVTAGQTEPLVDELRSGRQDLIIATRRPRGRALNSVPLADEEYVLVASTTWARRIQQKQSNTTRAEDRCQELCTALRDVPLVAYAEDLPLIRRYWRLIFGKQHVAEAAVTVPNLYAVVSAVAAGAGFSVLPRSLCEDHFSRNILESLHDPVEPPLNTLFLVFRPDPDANPDIARIRDALQQAARAW
jgi:DNA-binding transcriptional LysR family regulator